MTWRWGRSPEELLNTRSICSSSSPRPVKYGERRKLGSSQIFAGSVSSVYIKRHLPSRRDLYDIYVPGLTPILIGPPFVLRVFPRNCGPPSLSKCPPKSCFTGALFVCMSVTYVALPCRSHTYWSLEMVERCLSKVRSRLDASS